MTNPVTTTSAVSDWRNLTPEFTEIYLSKKTKRLYAYSGMAALSFTMLILTCFLPALTPVLWEMMFLTPMGITFAGGMFLGLAIGLSGFIDMWNHQVTSISDIQLTLSRNHSLHLLSVGPIVLSVGLLIAFPLTIAFPLLTPLIWSVITMSAASTILLAGMHYNLHSGMSIFYSFVEHLIGFAPLVDDLSFDQEELAHPPVDIPTHNPQISEQKKNESVEVSHVPQIGFSLPVLGQIKSPTQNSPDDTVEVQSDDGFDNMSIVSRAQYQN